MELVRRFLQKPPGSFFLFGPRGTGKSTWIRENYGRDAVTLDLLDAEAFRTYLARPERLRERLEGSPGVRHVIIDEIQRVPELLDVVHQIIETRRGGSPRFILTGSSARKLKRTGVNLLAGRLLLRTLHPFMAAELGEAFRLEPALRLGMLPLVRAAEDPEETLRSYASLYLREEVQAEALVRSVGSFSRFLEAVTFSQGAVLNLSAVARECEVGRKTVEGYVEILEDLLLGFRVPMFTRRARRLLASHPKFYFSDVGVFRALRPRGPLDSPEEVGGAAMEGLVAQHLRAWIAYTPGDHQVYYWRTKAGLEVDFVVYGDRAFAAVEVKSGRAVSGRDLASLRAFREDYPQAHVALVYGGRERLKIDGVSCIPCADFLRELTPGMAPRPG